ncbi:hypothetical protein [Streptomyces sp. NPDC048277]|uniref:hypothetical protein n=1 Tax=Streptomyces sp. NPDC048277 TaxID=3155027 RepID=UPI0034109A52
MPPDHALDSSYAQSDVPAALSQQAGHLPSISEQGLAGLRTEEIPQDHPAAQYAAMQPVGASAASYPPMSLNPAHDSSYAQSDALAALSQQAGHLPSISELGLAEPWTGQTPQGDSAAQYAAMQPGGAPPASSRRAHGGESSHLQRRPDQHSGQQRQRRRG